MYILEEYTFSPGEAGSGTITISGSFTQESFGVITNVTRGSVLYDPSEGRAGATITLEGGSTILTLEQNTTYCDELDKLQITVYDTEAGGGGGGGSDAILTEISEDTGSIDSKLPELTEGRIPVDIGGAVVNITGDVTVSNEVEVKNTVDDPIPVSDAGGSLTVDDGGLSITVDGPLTNTELRASAVPISASALPLPSGAATEAKQDTIIGHIDGIETVLGTIDTDTGSIDGKLPALSDGRIPVDVGEVEIKNDSGNPIPTLPVGVIDAGNGYSGTLTENQVFTGTGVEVAPKYGTISVCIFSSHSSASFGLKFQASIDNVNWETIEQYNYLAGSGLESYSFSPSGRFFRLQYTNGATATTKTAIFTVLRSGYAKSSSHRIGDTISPEKDAELVKAVLAAQKPNGVFTDINATASGNLKVSVEEVEGSLPVSGPLTNTELRASAVPISAAALPLPSGAATSAKQDTLIGHVDGVEALLTTIDADTGSIDGKLPALSSGRVPVVNLVPARTPTTTSVASSASSVTILTSNANRRGVSIANDSTAVLRLSFANPATSANTFIVMQPGSFLLLDQQLIVTNAIYGIWASANGTAQVTEYV